VFPLSNCSTGIFRSCQGFAATPGGCSLRKFNVQDDITEKDFSRILRRIARPGRSFPHDGQISRFALIAGALASRHCQAQYEAARRALKLAGQLGAGSEKAPRARNRRGDGEDAWHKACASNARGWRRLGEGEESETSAPWRRGTDITELRRAGLFFNHCAARPRRIFPEITLLLPPKSFNAS
jgi:hypothetical protein